IAYLEFAYPKIFILRAIEYTDILLAVMKRVEQTVHDKGLALNSRLLESITGWFAEVIYEEKISSEENLQASLEASLGTPKLWSPFASLSAKILGQIKTADEIRASIRQKIKPQLSQLIENINQVLTNARMQVDKDLLIIIDTLDRIPRERSEDIFLDHGEQLKSLDVNILTIRLIKLEFC
ncbi:MAG: hypothetical protein QME81_17180, partial [bacterium]|nr:hypothetical protein [bacterium]